MAQFNFLVWNCGGLNAPHKRVSSLNLLQQKRIDIALFQETHLLKADTRHLANKWYHTISFSASDNRGCNCS